MKAPIKLGRIFGNNEGDKQMTDSAANDKCAHPPCNCTATSGDYCSEQWCSGDIDTFSKES